ncbi:MAG: calcium/sodium antiporter [Xanthomonadales bacterium]|nr:calcium/sodium antiporter [Xanthomonadales bacterium]
MLSFLLLAFALLLLFVGAEALVRGAASLALRLGLSRLAVGLTVVAFGTSAPELVVSVEAALAGSGDLALGNVVGSNIFNVAVILGLAALICPIPVRERIVRLDAPLALGAALLLWPLLADGRIARVEAALLLAILGGYTALNLVLARRRVREGLQDWPDAPLAAGEGSLAWDLAGLALGLLLLVLGSELLVEQAIAIARRLGVSEAVIGLTLVAAGTSLPELATSLVAAVRRQPDIAIGNVVGSNVFNILGILGAAGLLAPLAAPQVAWRDLAILTVVSVLLLPLLYTGRLLHRLEGALLLAALRALSRLAVAAVSRGDRSFLGRAGSA